MATNPYFSTAAPEAHESVRQHLRLIVVTYLQAIPTVTTVPDAVLQALHPLLALPAVWAVIKQDLGL